jgi:RNA polymerase sigma-70 factor (ECF subfamily)
MLQPIMPPSAGRIESPPTSLAGLSPEETRALRLVVRGVIASVLGESKDHPDVEDCTHEVLSRAIEGSGRLREGEPLRPWVLGIARHVAIDALRSRKRTRRKQAVVSDEAPDSGPSWVERVADPGPGPEERAATGERAERLHVAMQGLTQTQRDALLLFHVEGLGYQQIAGRLGVPLGTVATWIARGRRSITEAVGEEWRD